MLIRPVEEKDFAQWLHMSVELWPQVPSSEHEQEMRECFGRETSAVFVAEIPGGHLVGFLEANIRYYAEDCATYNVGYIEGWFVEADFRRQGVGAALVHAAQTWALAKGCREMASDCYLDNVMSLAAHQAIGYKETSRLIHFVKLLKQD